MGDRGGRTEKHNVEKQVAAVELITEVADCQCGRSAHREKRCRHISP